MLRDVTIRDWMTADVISVSSDTPIANAHELMKRNNVRRLPVIDKGNLVGIVTIGDIREASPSGATTLSIWELNYLLAQLTVKNVMTHVVLTVTADEPMINAARIMLENKVSGLPVLDADGKVVGIVTESDVFRMMVEKQTEDI